MNNKVVISLLIVALMAPACSTIRQSLAVSQDIMQDSNHNVLLLRWTNRAVGPVTFEVTLVGKDTTVVVPITTWQVSHDSLCAAGIQYDVPVKIAAYQDLEYEWQVVECSVTAIDTAGNRSLPCPPVRFWDRRRAPR